MQTNTATAPPAGARAEGSGAANRYATVHEVVQGFLRHWRDEVGAGWILATDLPDELAYYCRRNHLVVPPIDLFRAALAKSEGVEASRPRLDHTTDIVLKALKRRSRRSRPALYRIADDCELAASKKPTVRRRKVAGEGQRLAA